uniref:NR LBD domain-containing protein n=1 Tax=Caenorhabditis tropicalis TaxID=1561998 RepID=A0A1I7TEZ1_9PELO
MPNYYLKESDRILNKFQLKNESVNVEKARSHLKFSYVLLFISIYMGFLRKTTMEEPLMKDIVALFAASAASIFKSKNLLAADQNRSQRIREFEESFNH